jgi:hypothetical protein
MQPLYLGDVPKGLGTPNCYCTIERGEEPYLLEPYRLLNLYGGAEFEDVKIWHTWVVLGFGSFVYFVPLETGEPIFFDIGYFWSLCPTTDCLLAASTSMVACYDQEAHLLWESERLGYDSVQISSVQGDRVMGIGNYPPFDEPAGQIPFTLSLHTGKLIT